MLMVEKVKSCENTEPPEDHQPTGGTKSSEVSSKKPSAPLGISISRARELLSFFTMSQNPNMSSLKISNPAPLPPLWVRCDRTDPQKTIWLGGEPVSVENKITGIILRSVSSNGPLSKENCSTKLEELKGEHKRRHHASGMRTKGFACFRLLDAMLLGSHSLKDTFVPPEIYVDFAWDSVATILETPPRTSAATLKFQVACGDPLSSVYEVSQELQFLLGLAKGLETGTTDWSKPSGGKPAVQLVQELLRDLKEVLDGLKSPDSNHTESIPNDPSAACSSVKTGFSRRTKLDFVEQLWCSMWRNVTSYEELVKCFTLIRKSLQDGELKALVHQGSNIFLSRLIELSCSGSGVTFSLSARCPSHMFLQMGIDKMKRDYFSYFIGMELAEYTIMDYFMSCSVDLPEQVHRLQKLHHVLEIVASCVKLLDLGHMNLIALTRSCMNYYRENPLDEEHVFQLPVRWSLVKGFCEKAPAQIWRVEITSGQGQTKARTIWQFHTTSPAEHVETSSPGLLDGTEAGYSPERRMYFSTLAECKRVPFR